MGVFVGWGGRGKGVRVGVADGESVRVGVHDGKGVALGAGVEVGTGIGVSVAAVSGMAVVMLLAAVGVAEGEDVGVAVGSRVSVGDASGTSVVAVAGSVAWDVEVELPVAGSSGVRLAEVARETNVVSRSAGLYFRIRTPVTANPATMASTTTARLKTVERNQRFTGSSPPFAARRYGRRSMKGETHGVDGRRSAVPPMHPVYRKRAEKSTRPVCAPDLVRGPEVYGLLAVWKIAWLASQAGTRDWVKPVRAAPPSPCA